MEYTFRVQTEYMVDLPWIMNHVYGAWDGWMETAEYSTECILRAREALLVLCRVRNMECMLVIQVKK